MKIIKIMGLMLLLIITMFTNVNAETQNELLRYEFEEGSGSIVLDSSEFNNHAVNDGGAWTNNNPIWGTYALNLDGQNDKLTSITAEQLPNVTSFSMWLRPDVGNSEETIFEISDTTENYRFYIDYVTDEIRVEYIDDNLTLQTIVLDTTPLVNDQWVHLVFRINNDLDKFCYIRDNQFPCNEYNATTGINQADTLKTLSIGENSATQNENYDGDIDEFRVFDFFLNETQIGELYNYNNVTLSSMDDIQPDEMVEFEIISSLSPSENESVFKPFEIVTTLYLKSTCDLYFNNQLYNTYTDVLSFSETFINVDEGENSYFVYCEYLDVSNNTLYYELSNTTYFNVSPNPPTNVEFTLIGNDFDVNNESLYLVSPCLNEGYSAIGMDDYKPYRSQYNPQGAYIQPIVNGYVNMNITTGLNEFCLYNGRIVVSGEGKTNNYDIVTYNGMLDLGKIDIPNNISTSYTLRLDQFEIYEKYNPKAWGTSWTGIIGSFILFLFGAMLIFGGVYTKEGKLAIAGALLLMVGIGGVTFSSGILGVIV